jgi:hypothetical protein
VEKAGVLTAACTRTRTRVHGYAPTLRAGSHPLPDVLIRRIPGPAAGALHSTGDEFVAVADLQACAAARRRAEDPVDRGGLGGIGFAVNSDVARQGAIKESRRQARVRMR